jgi:2-hydroxychromene-2-carboxylate isomerase
MRFIAKARGCWSSRDQPLQNDACREDRPVVPLLKIEFQFDFGSPNAYLAELALAGIERRTGVKFEYVPVLLGGIYKATNNMSPAESLRGIRNKPEYQALETQRFIRRTTSRNSARIRFFPSIHSCS